MGRFAVILVTSVLLIGSPVGALWPLPRGLQTGSKALKLSSEFSIAASFHGVPSDLQSAISRTEQQLKSDKLGRLVVGRGSSDEQAVSSAKTIKSLTLELSGHAKANSIATEAQKALEDRDEGYTLNVPADGSSAVVSANTTLGLFRGLTTFSQLWYQVNKDTYTIEAPIAITDSPAYVSDNITRAFALN
jgi:hexosaminidase